MKETTFINQNKKKWATFEKMSKQNQNDPDKMSQLFVELTDDLSYARTHYPKRSVRVYLNSLAQRVFHDLYKKQREPLSKFFTFWTTDLPLQMFAARHAVLAAFVIFTLGMLIGAVSTYDDPDFLGAVIGYDYVDMAEQNIANGKPMSVYGGDSEAMSFGQIAINNMRVAFITFVLGVFFSLGSGVFLFFNSIMVGAFQWFYVVRGLTLTSFLTIWIHGAFEIPAIILAAAAGITMGNGLLFPGTLSRGHSFVLSAKKGVKMMIGLIPVIIIAAFIEGFATRHTVISTDGNPLASEWPDSLKWLFILSCFGIILLYFIIYPFIVARKHNFTGTIEKSPQYIEKKELILYKIKDAGELFNDTFISLRKVLGFYSKVFLLTIPFNIVYLFLLFEKTPFFYYKHQANGGGPIGRVAKIIDNLEKLFVWNSYIDVSLFFFQVFVFAFNAFVILYAFKTLIINKSNPSFKGFFRLFLKTFWVVFLGFSLMGIIVSQLPFGIMLICVVITPFLFMWIIPIVISTEKYGKALNHGFTKPWKAWGTGIGLFTAITLTLGLIYIFAGLPIDIFKDMAMEWFVIPLADDPQYIFVMVDASIYITFSHFLFPIYLIGFSLLYYSVLEKEEARGLFKRLEHFGKKSKIYETKGEGKY